MSALLAALRLVPKNALSRAVGAAVRAPWPAPLVRASIRGFARLYGADLEEAERGVDGYRTFGEFFTRRLRPGARPVEGGADVVCSPVDGTVGEHGTIADGRLVQAKGRHYTAAELLASDDEARRFEGGTFLTIYLAPYNYHRIHAPLEGRITAATWIPGHLWPVNAKGVAEVDRLFAVNERLVTHFETDAGAVALVKVGATCVGRIRALYDDLVTNTGRKGAPERRRYEPAFEVARGGECAVFEMGSTVVLLFERGRLRLAEGISPGATVRMGQALGQVRPAEVRVSA